jgi:hypothetical protein
MADNLSFDITADSTKARADLALMESSLRKARRELKSFADEANKTGDTTKLTKVTQEIQRTEKAYASLKKEVRSTREESEGLFESISHAAHGNRGVARLIREFGTLNGSIENTSIIFGRLVGGLAGGVAVGAAIKGFEFLRDTLNEVSKNLGELRKEAGGLNLKPIQLQGAQHAVGAIGEEAEIATKALEGMNAQFEELRKHPPGAGATGAGSAFGVQVSRGGQPSPSDFGKPLQMLGIEAQVAAISGSRAPGANLKAARVELQALVQQARNFNSTDLNIISKTLFGGVPANSMLEVAPTLLKNWQKAIEELEHSSAGATDAALEEDKKLRISKDALSKEYEKAAGTLATTLRPAQIAFNEILGKALVRDADQFAKDWGKISHAWESFWTVMGRITKAGADEVRAEGKIDPANVLPDVNVTARGALPQAFRGPSSAGDVSGHGPESIGSAGYGPGSRATQSTTPGTSDYQAPTPNVISPLLSSFGALAESSKSAADAVSDLALASQRAAASALAVNASVNPVATPDSLTSTGFARGGFVRGPGSGTSDSILARLSAGEFVVNSARVRQVGLGFLQRLNGFADGGFVGPAPLRFAAGGLVPSAAGGGRAVHLHLGGGSFALSGHDSVVEALVSAAHSQQIRSAGVKPSWFAARPGG